MFLQNPVIVFCAQLSEHKYYIHWFKDGFSKFTHSIVTFLKLGRIKTTSESLPSNFGPHAAAWSEICPLKPCLTSVLHKHCQKTNDYYGLVTFMNMNKKYKEIMR